MIQQCVWKSDEEKIPEECLHSYVSLLIKAEHQRWINSGAAVEIPVTQKDTSERSIRDEIPESATSDPAWILLGHGNLIKTIHRYFQNLEPHRYCLSLTSKNRKPDRAEGKIRVLHVSSDSTPVSSDFSQSSTEQRTSSLNTQFSDKDPEFELYKKAVLCARLPVLGAPPTPSPYSPVQSPILSPRSGAASYRHSAFSFSETNSNFMEDAGATSQPQYRATTCVTPDSTGPIDSAELCNLVREAFQLSKRHHLYYENQIIKSKHTKDLERVLVEELLSQLSLLENNLHPFYSVQAFMDKNGYSEWLLLEKERIHLFIKSFWRSALPPLPALPVGYKEKHKEYKELMIRLIRHESRQSSTHTRYGYDTPTAPLPAISCRLLKEFGRRYGVGELYRRIIYLHYLAEHFENEIWYIRHVTALLENTMDISATSQEILVKEEFLLLLEAITLLLKHAKHSLTRIKRLFANNMPQGGVSSLLVMLEVVLQAKMTLRLSFSAPLAHLVEAQDFRDSVEYEKIEVLLTSFIENEIERRYERYKVICMDELNAHSIETTASPQLLNLLIIYARDEVKNYKIFFQQDFARYFDIVNLAAVKYYRLLMDDVDEVSSNPSQDVKDDEVDLQTLSLAFRLSVLDQDWSKYISVGMQTWRIPFQQLASLWLDALGYHMQHMVTMVMVRDPWTTVSIPKCGSRRQLAGISCPSRRRALTPSENSAFSSVRSLSEQSFKVREVWEVSKKKTSDELPAKVPSPTETTPRSSCREQICVLQHDDSSSGEEEPNHCLPVHVTVHAFPEQKPKHRKVDNNITDKSKSSKEHEKLCVETNNSSEPLSKEDDSLLTDPTDLAEEGKNQVYEPAKPVSKKVNQKVYVTEGMESTRIKSSAGGNRTPLQNGSDSETDYRETNLELDNESACSSDSLHFLEEQLETEKDSKNDVPVSKATSVHENVRCKNIESPNKTLRTCLSKERCAGPCSKCYPGTSDNSVTEIEEVVTGADKQKRKCSLEHQQSQIETNGARTSSEERISSADQTSEIKRPSQILRVVQPESESTSTADYQSCASSPGSFRSQSNYISFSSSETMHSLIDQSDEHTMSVCSDNVEEQRGFANESGYARRHQTLSAPASLTSLLVQGESRQNVLPISSSLVDLFCSINRLVAFTCHLCKILCSDEKPQRSDTGYVTCANEVDHARVEQSEEVKRTLCSKLVQVVCKFIEQYADNLLGLDTCGVNDELLSVILDETLLTHYKAEETAGHLIGCRYHSSLSQRCNTVDPLGHCVPACEALLTARNSPGGCEQTTSSMAVRITNGIVLRHMLQWLHEHTISCLQNPNLLVSNYQGSEGGGVMSEAYCQYGPCPDGSLAGSSRDVAKHGLNQDAEFGCEERVRNCDQHLGRIQKAQLVLLAYRMNVFVKQVIKTLLELNLPSFDIKKRLQPATEFLERKLKTFHQVLYPDCFHELLSLLWLYLVQDFMEECRNLREVKSKAYEQAKLLLQAIAALNVRCSGLVATPAYVLIALSIPKGVSRQRVISKRAFNLFDMTSFSFDLLCKQFGFLFQHMMQFFYGSGKGLPYDMLSSTSEPLVKILGLYTNSTDRLISMYHWLRKQVITREREMVTDDHISGSSMSTTLSGQSRAHAPADSLIQSMRKELHATRKCFSGSDLVTWVFRYVQKEGYDSLGVCIGATDMETGMEIGQYLLDHKLIVCIALPPIFDDSSSLSSVEPDRGPAEQNHGAEGVGESDYSTGKGSVLVDEEQQREMSVNGIAVANGNCAAVSEPRTTADTINPCRNSPYSISGQNDPQRNATGGFLDSVESIFFRSISVAEHAVFDNNPNAIYSFVREEDTNGSENIKLKLGFLDRLNAREMLLEIICVLYTRKNVDSRAKHFLRRINPQSLVTEAVGKEISFSCFAL